MRRIKRGEIYYADLGVTVGSEQRGIRPVLIIQNDIGNKYSPTTVVAPITSKVGKKSHQPTHVPIVCDGLFACSTELLDQIHTIDHSRLRWRVGEADNATMKRVEIALLVSIGISGKS